MTEHPASLMSGFAMTAGQIAFSESLPGRLRGTITMVTTDPDADMWRLRLEAATRLDELQAENERFRVELARAAGMVTPYSNATVRRMARVAMDALGQGVDQR